MKTLARGRDLDALLERLATLRPDSPRRWGRLTAHEMLRHLIDACRVATGEREAHRRDSFLWRTVVKWAALYVPRPWPHTVHAPRQIDPRRQGSRPTDFARDLVEVREVLRAFARRPPCAAWHPHPLFGPLTSRQWQRWGYLHVDHHLRQFGA